MAKVAPIIETERLILRGIEIGDTEDIVKWRSDKRIYQYFLAPHAISKEEHIKWYNTVYLEDERRIDWICLKKDTREVIGVFGIKRSNTQAEKGEISYLLSPEFRNCGFGREAVGGVIQWCETCGINEVIAVIHEGNKKSIEFIRSFGFRQSDTKGSFLIYEKLIHKDINKKTLM